jgi:hypothetical protein
VGCLVTFDLQSVGNFILPPWSFLVFALFLLWPLLGIPPWRAEPTWIDRLGRAVGWGWIVVQAGGAAAAYVLRM